jgi:hypothetical protein
MCLKMHRLTLLCSNYFFALTFKHIKDNNKEDITTLEISLLTVLGKNKLVQKVKETCAVYKLKEDS